MATIRKRNGRYHVQIRRKGFSPITSTFSRLTLARRWIASIEAEIENKTYINFSDAEKTTVNDVLNRYQKEILPTKKGNQVEKYRLGTLRNELSSHRLSDLAGVHIDRGYFPRTGVLDRMFNPRPGFHLVRHLNAALNRVDGEISAGAVGECPGGRYIQLQVGKGTIVLALPDTHATELSVPFGAAHGEQIDLGSGEIAPVAVENDNTVSVIVPMSNGVTFPVLIIPG